MSNELKMGRCWWLSPHRWTKWSAPDSKEHASSQWPEHGWINPTQFRHCEKCGRYERRWVPS